VVVPTLQARFGTEVFLKSELLTFGGIPQKETVHFGRWTLVVHGAGDAYNSPDCKTDNKYRL